MSEWTVWVLAKSRQDRTREKNERKEGRKEGREREKDFRRLSFLIIFTWYFSECVVLVGKGREGYRFKLGPYACFHIWLRYILVFLRPKKRTKKKMDLLSVFVCVFVNVDGDDGTGARW